MKQAWQSVKVTNEDSTHHGRAGNVVRSEKQGESELVFVELDATETLPKELVQFEETELALL